MHAMGPNVAGVIGSAIVAGISFNVWLIIEFLVGYFEEDAIWQGTNNETALRDAHQSLIATYDY